MINMASDIKAKREELGLSIKELADATGMGKEGDKLLRAWENGQQEVDKKKYKQIMKFATERPYSVLPENPAFRYIDLFAGIGGIRIPFQENNGVCVFTSEWDSFAQKTYKINFGGEIFGDITQVDIERDIPDFDILLGGFPCQPFSQAGLHKGFSDTRGTLFFNIEEIIRVKRPKAFLLENVKQLKGHDHGRTFQVIEEHLRLLNNEKPKPFPFFLCSSFLRKWPSYSFLLIVYLESTFFSRISPKHVGVFGGIGKANS